jgi:WD40 repeat protein
MVFSFDGQNVSEEASITQQKDVEDMRFSPDGQFLAVGAGKELVTIFRWDSRQKMAQYEGSCRAGAKCAST